MKLETPKMKSEEPIVSCEGLEFSYGPGAKVLKGASLQLSTSALGVIFGRSGEGKSTLLRCLLGYLRPSHGTIKWAEEGPFKFSLPVAGSSEIGERARQLATLWGQFKKPDEEGRQGFRRNLLYKAPVGSMMVFADCSNALPQLTAEQNIQLVLAPICSDANLRNRAADLLLNITGLTKFKHQKPGQLSSGQLRRLCLAQSLAANPRLLVWDEPTVSLDTGTKYELIRFIQALRSAVCLPGIIVTHDIETALLLADEIYLFGNGRIERKIKVNAPTPRLPEDIDLPYYRPIRAEMIRFLDSKRPVDYASGLAEVVPGSHALSV